MAYAVSILSMTTIVVGLCSERIWICDLLANLRLHAWLALLVLLPVQILQSMRHLAIATAAVLVVTVLLTIRGQSVSGMGTATSTDDPLTILSYNLGHGFGQRSEVAEYLEETSADVITLIEYSTKWHEFFRNRLADYPYSVIEARDNSFGIALYSRRPLTRAVVEEFPDSRIPYIRASATLADRRVDLMAVHLRWPMTPTTFAERNNQIDTVIELAGNAGENLVICGDWNLTPWSGWYRQIRSGNLLDGRFSNRLMPSWPGRLGWFGIAIDHCFATPDLAVETRFVGPALGPDHRPVSVRVNVPQP